MKTRVNEQFKEYITKTILLLCDIGVGTLVLLIAILLKKEFGKYGILWIKPGVYNCFDSIWWVSLFVALMFFIRGLYSKRLPFWDETREIIISVFYAVLISFSVIYLRKMVEFPRSILIFYFIISMVVFPIYRYALKLLLLKVGIYKRNMLVLGAGKSGKAAVGGILKQKEVGMEVVGFLDDFKKGSVTIENNTFKILGKIDDLKEILDKFKIEGVMIAMPSIGAERLSALASKVQMFVKRLYVVPEMKGVALSNAQLYNLFNEQMFLLKINNNLQYLRNKILKRIFDIVLSLLILPFVALLICFLGVLIKLDSKGPIFFTHIRVGEGGKKIKIYKFRSMYEDAEEKLKKILKENNEARKEWEANFKLKNDPRITRIGKFLRRTSLDELPQILNVLKGDMSFVGPRPVIEEEIRKYYKDKAIFYHMVKPGITGLWQVSGRSNTDYEYRVKIDAWYVLNWSLWLDIVILLKTVKVVLKKEGAY